MTTWCPCCGLGGKPHNEVRECIRALRATAEVLEDSLLERFEENQNRRAKLSIADLAEMRKMREEGMSFPEIGRRFKVHHTTVMHHLRTMLA